MRLNRLDLIRYGRFSNASIPFAKPAAGAPDVTVIFGPNEAGKSTTYTGFLELLFGFKNGAHPYAFRFARGDLVVGAELDLPGRGPAVFRRNSKKTQSLLDAQDRPVDEAILASALHGMTRDSYEERFSLNEQGLREGGARIAGAQGDLGQLLHAGLSGLTGIADTLDVLTGRADRFYKKGGRGTLLKTQKDRLREISRELRTDTLTVERERNLRRDRDLASAAFDSAHADLQQAIQRQAASKAAAVWYETTAKMERLTEALAGFPDGPDLAPDAAGQVAGLVEQIKALTLRITETGEEIDKMDRVVADNPFDPQAEPLTTELQRLDRMTIDGAPLMGRASTAQADLARRRDEQTALTKQMETELHHLGLSGTPASTVALDAAAVEALAEAVQLCSTTDSDAAAARHAAQAARAQQGDAPREPQDLTVLRAAFDQWKAVENTSALETSQNQALDRLTKATAALPQSWAALVAEGLPAPETVATVVRHWTDIEADLGSAQKDLEKSAAELAEVRAHLHAQMDAPEAVDVVKTEETRRQRDAVWRQHRSELTDETANLFQAAMYEDDAARARFLIGAGARERVLALQDQERTAAGRHQTAQNRYDTAITKREQLSQRCAGLALALGLDADTPPSAFGPRLQALTFAAEAAADLSNAERALKDRRAAREATLKSLTDAAQPLGVTAAPGDLPAEVQRALTLEESDRKAWSRWQEGEKSIAKLDSKAEEYRRDFENAQRTLGHLTASLPLPDLSFTAIRKAMPHLRNLQRFHDEHRKLSGRIESLAQAIAALDEGAARLCEIMGTPRDQAVIDPVQIIDQARNQTVRAARMDEKREEALARKAEVATQKRRAEIDRQDAMDALDRCFEGQGHSDLPPRERVSQLVERDRLRAEKDAADQQRLKAREGVVAGLFEEELSRMPDVTRASELELALADAQSARDTALGAHREADRVYHAAYETGTHSDLATEKATLLEELRSGARHAAVATAGRACGARRTAPPCGGAAQWDVAGC